MRLSAQRHHVFGFPHRITYFKGRVNPSLSPFAFFDSADGEGPELCCWDPRMKATPRIVQVGCSAGRGYPTSASEASACIFYAEVFAPFESFVT